MSEQVTIVVSADEGELILDALVEMINRNLEDKHWMDLYQKIGPQVIPDPSDPPTFIPVLRDWIGAHPTKTTGG